MSIAVNSKEMPVAVQQSEGRSKKNTNGTKYQVGDQVQGTVMKVTDQISIQFSEKTADVPKNTLPDAKEGDILNFRIMGILQDGTMNLQYIPGQEGNNQKNPASFTAVMKGIMPVQGGQSDSEDADKSIEEEQEELKKVQNSMTQEDYDELSKEGFSLERYELERFERALERIKVQRADQEQFQTQKVEQIKKTEEEFKKSGLSQISDPVLKKQIAVMLEHMNLPASSQNITAVLGAVKLAGQATELSEDSMSYLLSNRMEATPVNIYMANYNAKPMQDSNLEQKKSEWEQLKDQAAELVQQMNYAGIPSTMNDAQWLFEHELDISSENVIGYQQLRSMRDHFSVSDTIMTIVTGMSEGVEPIRTLLADKNSGLVQCTIDQLSNVSEEALENVVDQGKHLNLMNLRDAQDALADKKNNNSNETDSYDSLAGHNNQTNQSEIQKELNLVTARRQLEEIRVKLTYEAGMKLAGKGINLQTEGLETMVTELRNLEHEYYSRLLNEGGVQVSDSNILQLKNTMDQTALLAASPEYVLGVRFDERSQMTISTLAEQGQSLTEQFQRANETYEQLMTAPRSDMGDSIGKAFSNMDSLLEEMGIAPTQDNKRAVRILGYNQMEINETSIEQMKDYDHQVTSLIKALQPSTVVELIKNHVNPLDTPCTELTKHVQDIAKENGETKEQKFSSYLVKLQKSETLTDQERDSYIGVYRLLNQVEKSDGKAIGYLVNTGREITLNSLLSAVRTIKGPGIDANIDNSFGTIESFEGPAKSISRQMEAAFSENEPLNAAKNSYNAQLTEELYENITPQFIDFVQKNDNIMDVTMERLNELYQEYASMNPESENGDYQEMLVQVQQVANMTDEMEFIKGQGKKLSIQNIKSAHTILKESNQYFEHVMDLLDGPEAKEAASVIERSQSMGDFVKNYENVVNSISGRLRERMDYPTLSIEDMLAMNQNLTDTAFMKELSTNQYYQIPLSINGQTIGVGVSIQPSGKEKGKLSITMNSRSFGAVQADVTLSGQELRGLIVCENKAATVQLRNIIDNLKKDLPEEIHSVQMNVCTEHGVPAKPAQAVERDQETQTATNTLFQVAKTIITGIKEIDL